MKSIKLIYLTHSPRRQSVSACLFPLHHSILFNCCSYWSCYTPHYIVLVVIDLIIILQAYWIKNASIDEANIQARSKKQSLLVPVKIFISVKHLSKSTVGYFRFHDLCSILPSHLLISSSSTWPTFTSWLCHNPLYI